MKTYYQLYDENQDGILDCVLVLTKEYGEPLVGDYLGVRLAYIPFSNEFGKKRAEELARIYCKALEPVPTLPANY